MVSPSVMMVMMSPLVVPIARLMVMMTGTVVPMMVVAAVVLMMASLMAVTVLVSVPVIVRRFRHAGRRTGEQD
jgi:hypothetical protein